MKLVELQCDIRLWSRYAHDRRSRFL